MVYTAENLRYLLWKRGIKREQWIEEMIRLTGCDGRRAESLLLGGETLTPDEQRQIVANTPWSEEDLQYSRLVEQEGASVLAENLKYLLDSLEHGKKKRLAEELEVSPVTVSRWASGEQLPQRDRFARIGRFFELEEGKDLEQDPLFLSLLPISYQMRRTWLHQRIDQLHQSTLHRLFPALERLFRDP